MIVRHIKLDQATFIVHEGADSLKVQARGEIIGPKPSAEMKPFFEELHTHIRSRGLREVTLDVQGLTLVNSSAIVAFLVWIRKVHALNGDKYRIRILHDPGYTWQRISLRSIRNIAPDVVCIEAGESSAPPPQSASGG